MCSICSRKLLVCSIFCLAFNVSAFFPNMQRLAELCQRDDSETLLKILQQHSAAEVDDWINTADGIHAPPLAVAASTGAVAVQQLLFSFGANPDIVHRAGDCTPLFLAARFGYQENAQGLLQNRANPNTFCLGVTALYTAIHFGRLAVIKCLLEHGVNANAACSSDGETPLCVTAQFGFLRAAQMLVSYGADPDLAACGDKITPVNIAAECGHFSLLRYLVECGANPNAISGESRGTLLHSVVQSRNGSMVRFLLAHGACPNAVSASVRRTPLFSAVLHGDFHMAQTLLDYGADPDYSGTPNGWTPLFWACKQGHVQIVKLLLRHNATVATDHEGNTPLHIAVQFSCPVIVTYLLQIGVDPSVRNHSGQTANDMRSRSVGLVPFCRKAVRTLVRNAIDGRSVTARLSNWLHYQNPCGEDIRIHEAIRLHRDFLSAGSLQDLQKPRHDGCTPLHLAVLHENIEALCLLIMRGVFLAPLNLHWDTPLSLAVQGACPEAVEVLGPAILSVAASDQEGLIQDRLRLASLPPFRLQTWAAASVRRWFSPCELKHLWTVGTIPVRAYLLTLAKKATH